LHVDGYLGFEQLADKEGITLAACWSHSRRKFYDVAEATASPVATEALRWIGELYAIEARIRGQSPAYCLAERRTFSKPIVDALNVWLDAQLRHFLTRSGRLAKRFADADIALLGNAPLIVDRCARLMTPWRQAKMRTNGPRPGKAQRIVDPALNESAATGPRPGICIKRRHSSCPAINLTTTSVYHATPVLAFEDQ